MCIYLTVSAFAFFFFGRAAWPVGGSLVPRPGIKPMPPVVEAWSLNHWTAREFPTAPFFLKESSPIPTPPVLVGLTTPPPHLEASM